MSDQEDYYLVHGHGPIALVDVRAMGVERLALLLLVKAPCPHPVIREWAEQLAKDITYQEMFSQFSPTPKALQLAREIHFNAVEPQEISALLGQRGRLKRVTDQTVQENEASWGDVVDEGRKSAVAWQLAMSVWLYRDQQRTPVAEHQLINDLYDFHLTALNDAFQVSQQGTTWRQRLTRRK